jgi:glycosyltransferase involved in cell wall biosynthesis
LKAHNVNLSIIIPVFNESESLPRLHQALQESLKVLPYCWEVVLVDDGSADGSLQVLEELARLDPEHVRVVVLRRNFGQTTAIAAGIDYAGGDVLVIMDADLQNDPADIPMMLAKLEEGYDVVSGWRIRRQDTFLTRKLPSMAANWLISKVTGVYLHDYGCMLKAYRREVLSGIRLYGEMHRFIPAYARLVGAKMIEVPVRHHPRKFGKTKYGLGRTVKVILDLVTVKFLLTYANKPIYLFGGTGIAMIAGSLVILAYLILMRILYNMHMIREPLLLVSMMLFILGFQSILMGLIAELLVRTYHESQHKPTYTLRRVINAQTAVSTISPAGLAGNGQYGFEPPVLIKTS